MLTITGKFPIDGSDTSSVLGDEWAERVQQVQRDAIRMKIEAVTCPIHAKRAGVTYVKQSSSDFIFQITCCCDSLAAELARTIHFQRI